MSRNNPKTFTREFGPIDYEGFALSGEYEYTGAIPAIIRADPNDSDPGEGEIVEIMSVYLDGDTTKNIYTLLDPSIIQWLEDRIYEGLRTEWY